MFRHPRRRPAARILAAAICAVVVSSCSSDTTRLSTTSKTSATSGSTETTISDAPITANTEGTKYAGPTPDTSKSFGWTEKSDGVEEGSLDVPIDPAKPKGAAFTLYIERHRAIKQAERIGSLLVNPGGPGYGGTELAEFAERIYGQHVLDHFDIVAWDPRGTGRSRPAVDCVDQYDPYFALDSSPDTPAEQHEIVSAAASFGNSCKSKDGAFLPFVSTRNSAGDMDSIRAALGEDTISYFGFSYGSELGVSWASLYPKTVRAMVIDGAADTTVDYLHQNLEQAAGFESTFDTFLGRCAKDTSCEFYNGGDPGTAFDTLNEAADANPAPSVAGRPSVTQGVLTTAVADAMYTESLWPQLETALADLQNGDGKGILDLYDDYYERTDDGTYGNELEAYFAINCVDDPGTKDPSALFAMQDEFARVAPRLGASWILELQFCATWPVPAAPPVPIDAKGAGPVVVVGTTGDPATPLEGTRHTSDALEDGHVIVVTADQHTGYGVNACVNDAVDNYLVSLDVPADGLACK